MIENSQLGGGYVLHHGGERIPFQIEYRPRKTLAISVHPDSRLEVLAPKGIASAAVLPRVERRAGWIVRQLRYFEQFRPTHPGPRYVAGETHLYLGRQYRLKLHTDPVGTVKLLGPYLHVWTEDRRDGTRVKGLLNRWYRSHAERVFERRLEVCQESCPSLRTAEPRLTIRQMSRRWGSCTGTGNILLNLDLIKAPVHCIDYVIVHELCHLQIHNHSPDFYRLLARCLPDWEHRKARLASIPIG